MDIRYYSDEELRTMLEAHNIGPTRPRIAVARCLLTHADHVSAEDLYVRLNHATDNAGKMVRRVSKATVYNTLGLFAERGMVREIFADPARVFYDPNTMPHHHFYDVDNGELMDIPAASVELGALPPLPEGATIEGVDVIIRIRRESTSLS